MSEIFSTAPNDVAPEKSENAAILLDDGASTPSLNASLENASNENARSSRRRPFFRVRRLFPFCIGSIAFLLYAFCVAPTVTYGSDCGEFAATVWNLGVGHPTGFALYCVVARLFVALLPFGEVAWRLNILSALCGALTVGITCATLLRVLDVRRVSNRAPQTSVVDDRSDLWASGGASLLLAGFYFLFGQAVIIDVHIMIAAMTALLIYCAVRWHHSVLDDQPDFRWLYSLAVLAGLALNTHMSWIFAFPGLFGLCLWHHRKVLGTRHQWWRRLGNLLAFVLAAYAVTLYLPLRASLFPAPQNGQWWPLSWSNVTNFPNWYAHVRAHQYEFLFLQPAAVEFAGRSFVVKWLAASPLLIPGKIAELTTYLAVQWLWAFFLIPVGAIVAWKRDRALGKMLGWIAFVNLGFEINYNVSIAEMANFLFSMYLIFAIWMGFGLHAALRKVAQIGARWDERLAQRISSTRSEGKRSATGWKWRLGVMATFLVPATICAQWSMSIPAMSKRGDTRARDAALERADAIETLQRQFPQREVTALVTGSDDALWTLWYAQFVLGRARGAQTPWGLPLRRRTRAGDLPALMRRWQARGPVACSYFQPEVDARYPLVPLSPNGLMWLASTRQLSLPATPISKIEYSKLLKSPHYEPVLSAAFPVNSMQQNFDADGKSQGKSAHLKRENLTMMTLDFRAPFVVPLSSTETGAPTVDASSSPAAVQSGFIEILLSPTWFFKAPPPPDQQAVGVEHWIAHSPLATEYRNAPLRVTRQTLRLVVPQTAKLGDVLRAQLPLQIGVESLGEHVVWIRLVRQKNDVTTPWQRVATFQVTNA